MAIDETKLNAFMGNFVHDVGAVMDVTTIVVGDQLELYKALAQAGEARIRDVVTKGGFHHFRRVTETPFNLIYEARP